MKSPRPYRQAARAEAAAETSRRIVEAFVECTGDCWFDEITLEDVARRAGVSVRSVIRLYGGKEGLIKAIVEQIAPGISAARTVVPGNVAGAVAATFDLYEAHGDKVMRSLAQESRYPALAPLLDHGRKEHRRITEEIFAPWLTPLPKTERANAVDALVVATDIYVWKLLRRDMGRPVAQSKAAMTRLINAILREYTGTSIKGTSR